MRWILVALLTCSCRASPATTTKKEAVAVVASSSASSSASSACSECHAEEARDWQTSMHHASYSSADFQRSYHAEPHQYCVDCHAPLHNSAEGIGCTACHTVSEGHRVTTTKACKTCHDFDVPNTRAILQSTAREHRESALSQMSCESCHMPPRGAQDHLYRDHRFSVSRSSDVLRGAIRVHSARIESGGAGGIAVVVSLVTNHVGHRFPTGDIFRRLTITLTAYRDDNAVVAGDTFHLSRDWDNHRASLLSGTPEAIDVDGDTRLTDVPREFRIASTQVPARVHVTVLYERGRSAEGAFFEAFESLEILDTDVDTAK